MKLCFLFILCFSLSAMGSYSDELKDKALKLNLSQDQQWLNLLHFKNNFFGLTRSQVASTRFFLSPTGYKDAQSEMDATLQAFFSSEPQPGQDQPAQCQYPARFRYLQEKLQFDRSKLKFLECDRFDKFLRALEARSVSVVFSSYYLNNPSSMFGHTFIRLNKARGKGAGERFELLDYGINYAADANESNPILYAFYGMAGLFKGTFTSIPYYYKVRQYNDFDSRDLWEYQINLTQKQVDMLVAHIWEMGPVYFNYFYLTQNCSFHIFTLIDAAAPELNLSGRTRYYVIPAETVKVLFEIPGLVEKVAYRPSLRTIFDKRVEGLSRGEKQDLKMLLIKQDFQILNQYPSAKDKASLLDAALDFTDYKFADELLNKDPAALAWKQKLLIARSQLDIVTDSPVIEPPPEVHPENSHGAARVALSSGVANSQSSFTHLGFRFALHDLADRFVGYPEYAQIDFLSFEGRYTHDNKRLEMEEASIIKIMSLNDFSAFNQKPSWHARLGATRVRDASCDHCFPLYAEAGVGLAKQAFKTLTPFVMVDGDSALHSQMYGGALRLGVGPRGGLRFAPSDHFVMMLDIGARYYFLNNNFWTYRQMFVARYAFNSHWAINLKGQRVPESDEAMLGFMYYY